MYIHVCIHNDGYSNAIAISVQIYMCKTVSYMVN